MVSCFWVSCDSCNEAAGMDHSNATKTDARQEAKDFGYRRVRIMGVMKDLCEVCYAQRFPS